MVSSSARHRLATLTSWTLAVLVVGLVVSAFLLLTQPETLEATGLRNVPPTATPIVLMPTPTPEPKMLDAEPWAERAEAAATEREIEDATLRHSVQQVIDFAASDVGSWSSDAIASIAVVLLDKDDVPFADRVLGVQRNLVAPSASLAKAYWVTAATAATLDDEGQTDSRRLAAVERRASAIFTWSSNDASTALISSLGVDEINTFTDDLGLTETFLTQWAAGQRSAEPNPHGSGNTTSTSDAVRFLDTMRSARRADPPGPVATQVLDWMLLAPDSMATGSYGGVFTDRLPETVSPFVAHKAGWLPPECCRSEGNTLNAMGLVDLEILGEPDLVPPDARSYGLAISVTNGRSYDEHASFIAWTSCLVFQTLVDSGHGCGESQDIDGAEPA